ncbi:MAG: hypothetical protein JXA33_28710 [Anaerolineae bacterium]|nr:hypothetical protein [Anaerolineae bacterium]
MSGSENSKNVYLEQVMQQQEEVDRELRRKAPAVGGAAFAASGPLPPEPKHVIDEGHIQGANYRITGFWIWQTVVVPPNVYVVHTRRGYEKPIHIGLGLSFRFNPYTDAFLIIPATVQTILINANCICIERQGILVQAYVQWIIDDIETAYRKLDFSDPGDPMRLVNVQLREQAEAAIKDKVATMSIDEVLSDKQPIIEELTHRLRAVAEGNHQDQTATSGLGLKIVTIQIKEAVVSSTRLWESLQKPFRAERQKLAQLAEIASQQEIMARELTSRMARQTEELEADSKLAQLRAQKEREQFDMEQSEKQRRHKLEQETERQVITEQNMTAKLRQETELELTLHQLELEKRRLTEEIEQVQLQMQVDQVQAEATRAQVTAELDLQEQRNVVAAHQTERELAQLKIRRDIENDLSERAIQAHLIAQMPEIAQHLPAPTEQRTTLITTDAATALSPLTNFLAHASMLFEDIFKSKDKTPGK